MMLLLHKKLKKMFLSSKPLHWLILIIVCLITWLLWFEVPLQALHNAFRPFTKMQTATRQTQQQQQQEQQQHDDNIPSADAALANGGGDGGYPSYTAQNNGGIEDFDYEEQLVVLYNRVPKTGSTSFVNIAYDLCKRNKFHVLHINVTANMHVLSLPNQISFVRNVTKWHEMKPALYHGHMAFLDFSKFQIAHKPIYINIVRKPLDRLVSYYYFLRYGDNYRPNLVRKKAGNKITFDECVESKQPDCDPKNMWLQIPFFCGHAMECWEPGSEWALDQAKRNLVNEYFLVGVTEQMEDFVDLLERSLPRIFHGFREHYQHSNKSHLRQTSWKSAPSEETINTIKKSKIWQMENDLYEFALAQFEFNKRKLTVPDNKHLQKFMYEKIRPK